MVVEAESGFHFRRVDGGLRLAMGETTLRWGTDAQVDEGLVEDWLGGSRRDIHRPPAWRSRAPGRASTT